MRLGLSINHRAGLVLPMPSLTSRWAEVLILMSHLANFLCRTIGAQPLLDANHHTPQEVKLNVC
jgi:hypothetical protein